MTSYQDDIYDRIKLLIQTYVTVFKSTQEKPGTVFDSPPMALNKAWLPCIILNELDTTYGDGLGNNMVFYNPEQIEIAYYVQEWTPSQEVNIDRERIATTVSELENLFRQRTLLEHPTTGQGLSNVRSIRLISKRGNPFGRHYPPLDNQPLYVVKSLTLNISYSRSI